jgi:hypothetical protein
MHKKFGVFNEETIDYHGLILKPCGKFDADDHTNPSIITHRRGTLYLKAQMMKERSSVLKNFYDPVHEGLHTELSQETSIL